MRTSILNRREMSGPETSAISEFLAGHYATVFHEPRFNAVVADIFKTDFSYQLVSGAGGELVAVCPYHSYTRGPARITHSNPTIYEVPYGGWVYDEDECDIRDLMRLRKPSWNEVLFYWSIPRIGRDLPETSGRRTAFKTAFIELGESEDRIFQSAVGGKRRNMIRKAVKSGIRVETLAASEMIVFHDLIRQTYAAAGIPELPASFHDRIIASFEPAGRAAVLAARHRGEIIAAAALVRNHLICHYWLGASRAAAENLGQGELLQWEAIKWAKRQGCRYYDLCVIEEERLPNIARFKMGFSQTIVPFYCVTRRGLLYRLLARSRLWR